MQHSWLHLCAHKTFWHQCDWSPARSIMSNLKVIKTYWMAQKLK